MSLVIFLLLAFFCAIAFMQHMKKEEVNSGSRDQVIKKLLSDYKTLREHADEIDANAFTIGPAREKHRGGLADNPKVLAVRILDEKGKKRDGAARLGMEVIETGGRHYYQFTTEPEEKLSDAEMTAILPRIKEKLERRYPNDLVSMAASYLTVVIDGKKLLDSLGAHSGSDIPKKSPKKAVTEKAGEQLTSAERVNFGAKPFMFPQPVLIIGTYDENGTPNAMNAAWGITTDFAEITISLSEHKTTDNLLARGAFTVSMATEDYAAACDYVGIVSAADVPDKFERAGFHATKSAFVDAPLIKELPMALECRVKSYSDEILVGEIVNVCADESVLTDGKVDPGKLRPITFDPVNSAYLGLGKKVGNAFRDGLELK